MNQNPFDLENQCELSYELLYLLKWLIENETVTLKKIISRVLYSGLKEELSSSNRLSKSMNSDAIQNSIVDFLDLLDSLLHETLHEGSFKKVLEQNLMPAINKIDYQVCDKATVQCSLEKTSDHLEDHPNTNAKEMLFKEILKRWKPHKKKMQN